MNFYDDVLRELLVAFGGALFLGNVLALWRRRSEAQPASREKNGQLTQAPLIRSVLYGAIGFVFMAWGIASIVTR